MGAAGQLPATVASENEMATVGSHASTPVAVPVTAGAVLLPQATVTLAGQVMVGGVVSIRLMVCWQVTAGLHPSFALQVRVMVLKNGQGVLTLHQYKLRWRSAIRICCCWQFLC
jgi:hypothetical protein